MKRIKAFFTNMFIGGVTVLLPTVILIFFFNWLLGFVTDLIAPFALQIRNFIGLNQSIATTLAFFIIIFACVFIGMFVKTRIGKWLYRLIEERLLMRVPGYKTVRDAIKPFINTEKTNIFDTPVMVKPFGNNTMVTGFLTDIDEKRNLYSVFVPTSPNPTNGFVYHVGKDDIQYLDSPFDEVMGSIIIGGKGTSDLERIEKDEK